MGETFEVSKTRFNVLIFQLPQAVETKALYGKGSHDASENNRSPQADIGKISRGRQMPHKTAGERITGTGRIFHHFQRKRRRAEDAFFMKHQDAILSPFDNEIFGPACQNVFRDFDQTEVLAEFTSFSVIDDEHVDLFQHVPKGFRFP